MKEMGLRKRIQLRSRMNLRFWMNLWPKLHMVPCLFGLIRPQFVHCGERRLGKVNWPLRDLSASPQVNINLSGMEFRMQILRIPFNTKHVGHNGKLSALQIELN